MEGIINLQKELQNAILKGHTNYKKSPKERITKEYIETRLENLERDWSLCRVNHSKLYETYNSETIAASEYANNEIYDKTEDAYIEYKAHLKIDLNKVSSVDKPFNTGNADEPNSSFVKLPKISIPVFSGKYSEWTTFRDLFISLIHKNKHLDNVQKLHYLKGHLTGEAEQLIRQTPISDANYEKCWTQLENRYDNKKYLSNCILKRLLGQRRALFESASALKELLDTTMDCLNALSNLGINVSTWDVIVIHLISYKLDPETRKQWELHTTEKDTNELPTLNQFKAFIENRFRALECLESKRIAIHQGNNNADPHNSKTFISTTNSTFKCEFCSEPHKLCFCKQFSGQPLQARRDFVAKNKMCFNCLGGNHTVYECKVPTNCRLCNKRHHSLLHQEDQGNRSGPEQTCNDGPSTSNPPSVVSCLSTGKIIKRKQVLLATALVNVESYNGQFQVVRALLDQGSQASFITEDAVQLLRLKKTPMHGVISGLGQNQSLLTKSTVTLLIQSRVDPQFKLKLEAYVLNKITSDLPEKNLGSVDWVEIQALPLADPQFNMSSRINILLGANVYSKVLREGLIKSPSGSLIGQNTTLGWIISGVHPDSSTGQPSQNIHVMHAQINEDECLKKFWEIEEQTQDTRKILTDEEQKCEELFEKTTTRTNEGRYVVKLPFREEDPPCKFGGSRKIAVARLNSLEKRFEKDKELKEKYTEVINEYLQLNHMRAVPENDLKKEEAVYLPHHAVVKNDRTTTKVRVVFNASQKNKNGVSLNDTLMIGPRLQPDLRHIILRWRTHAIGLVADIVKMYRQVRVTDEDASFQRMVWRDHPSNPIKDYELLTVTFGTASAPYLAVKALQQTAIDEGEKHPVAAEKVLNCFYVDDLMTGCNTVEEGVELFKQTTKLLAQGGFPVQKWNSNNKEILKEITKLEQNGKVNYEEIKKDIQEKDIIEEDKLEKEIKLDDTLKVLGLFWNREEDKFQYKVNIAEKTITESVTKRTIIADISRIFDPLGWIAPSIVLAKIFIQKLWLTGLGWDETLNTELTKEWYIYRNELSELSKIEVPRWLNTKPKDQLTELHGFCDASKAAYAAVVYLRTIDKIGLVRSSLLVAKTRVAPIKQVSIPRLELCGAVLLTKLLTECADVLKINNQYVHAWTDSTIVLAWLNSHPSRWRTFVGNRVSEILSRTDSSQWCHVSTKQNPADDASRGQLPTLMINNCLWFSGPEFLREQSIIYKKPKDLNINLEEVKTHFSAISEDNMITRFSSLQRLLRVLAFCKRFITKEKGYLRNKETQEVLQICIKKTQREYFEREYKQLIKTNHLQDNSSRLKSLCPYLDDNGIIRVSGRLQRAQLNYQTKHPIVLPKDAHLTRLIITDAHDKTLHGGPSLMMQYLRSAYWIIGARNLVRQHVHRCITCVKQGANVNNQLMGSLPSSRCTPARPFLNCGVDYAGPINLRTTKGRGHRSYKGYICLFVCMATRAIHLEVVSDMTTQAFIAAFKRFTSRRGHCARMWSDNGTTFVGAAKELQELKSIQPSIAENLQVHGTEWHFIPPHAPNFGGLWEAGIKSTKFHLKRVIGDSTLTYEEMSTLLCQVEACLNSRPLSLIDTVDPGEPLPLTPGHFLIGEPILIISEQNYEQSNINNLSRWQFVQRMLQNFWTRWSHEYLNTLMQRSKWTNKTSEPNIGDVVLIKEDDLPPSRWLLGRVINKHPGSDGISRVVTLRTKSSVLKRPTSKLCILPLAN